MSHPGEPLPSPGWLGVCVDASPWDLVLVQLGKCALDSHQSSFCASPFPKLGLPGPDSSPFYRPRLISLSQLFKPRPRLISLFQAV